MTNTRLGCLVVTCCLLGCVSGSERATDRERYLCHYKNILNRAGQAALAGRYAVAQEHLNLADEYHERWAWVTSWYRFGVERLREGGPESQDVSRLLEADVLGDCPPMPMCATARMQAE